MPEKNEITNRVGAAIALAKDQLEPDEGDVLRLLESNWSPGLRISQREIAATETWLVKHPDHRKDLDTQFFETATRAIREAIRALRVAYKIPVLSDGDGYWLPNSQEEVDKCLARMESEAKARATASLATYTAMKEALGVKSAFFDQIAPEANDALANGVVEELSEPESGPEVPEAEESEPESPGGAGARSAEEEAADEEEAVSVGREVYIGDVVRQFIIAIHPEDKEYTTAVDGMVWEAVPGHKLKWRAVFKDLSRNARNDLRYAFQGIGMGFPDFVDLEDGRHAMCILCTTHTLQQAFKWKRRMANFEAGQKRIIALIREAASRANIDIVKCAWRPSRPKPTDNYVFEFPRDKQKDCLRLRGALGRSGLKLIYEHASPHKIIFSPLTPP